MKISIVASGKIKEKYLRDGINEFVKRLKPFTQLEFIEINEEKMKDNYQNGEGLFHWFMAQNGTKKPQSEDWGFDSLVPEEE